MMIMMMMVIYFTLILLFPAQRRYRPNSRIRARDIFSGPEILLLYALLYTRSIAVPVVLATDGLTRSGMTTTYHLRISGGAQSVVVIAERRHGPCRL